MKKYALIATLVTLLSACGDKTEQTSVTAAPTTQQAQVAATVAGAADNAVLVAQANAAVQALAGTLKGELEAAMNTGGPVEAMGICNTKAPAIAEAVSATAGMSISRVSLKNRNPEMGKANDWQTTVLNDFEAKKTAGAAPADLVYTQVVDNEFRFMKAIPTAAVCLKCHGTDLSPAVTAKLTELYPSDKATGYKEGDLRGAFVVVKHF